MGFKDFVSRCKKNHQKLQFFTTNPTYLIKKYIKYDFIFSALTNFVSIFQLKFFLVMSRFGSSMFYRKGHVIDEFQFFSVNVNKSAVYCSVFPHLLKKPWKEKSFLGRSRSVLRILWHITCFRKKLHLGYLTGFWMRRSSRLGNDLPCLGFF